LHNLNQREAGVKPKVWRLAMGIAVETPVARIDIQEPVLLDMNKLVVSIGAFAQTESVVLGKVGGSVKLCRGVGASRTALSAATTGLGRMKDVSSFTAFGITPGTQARIAVAGSDVLAAPFAVVAVHDGFCCVTH
jgi:hypothetical protein